METKKEKQIVPKGETYRAVLFFFERFAEEKRDEFFKKPVDEGLEEISLISIICDDMHLLPNGIPADNSVEEFWQKALSQAEKEVGKKDKSKFAYQVAYNLMKIFYENNKAKPEELKNLINRIDKHEDLIDRYWEESMERAEIDTTGANIRRLLGMDWFEKANPDGTYTWARAQHGKIVNAGINWAPLSFWEDSMVPKGRAYRAAFYFFEKIAFPEIDKSSLKTDEPSLIVSIPSEMSLLQDGWSADNAMEVYWQDALTLTEKEIDRKDKERFAYQAAYNLIKVFYVTHSCRPKEYKDLMNRLEECKDPIDRYWEEAWQRAETDTEGVMLTFDGPIDKNNNKDGFFKKLIKNNGNQKRKNNR